MVFFLFFYIVLGMRNKVIEEYGDFFIYFFIRSYIFYFFFIYVINLCFLLGSVEGYFRGIDMGLVIM